jgi:hypothetical protein
VLPLAQEKLDKIKRKLKADIEVADHYYEAEIEPKLINRYQVFESDEGHYDKKFPNLSKKSRLTSADVQNTIEWIMPALMRQFYASADVVTITGETAEDDGAAEVMQELVNFQIRKKNPGFLLIYNWLKDMLVSNLSIVKGYWRREYGPVTREVLVGREQAELIQAELAAAGGEFLSSAEIEPGVWKVRYRIQGYTANYPVIENVSASEFRYSPKAKTIKDSMFVAQRKIVTVDHLRRKEREGIYQNVAEVIEKAGNARYTGFDRERNPQFRQKAPVEEDEARKEVVLYECYVKYSEVFQEDGTLEDLIICYAEDTILRIEENSYGRPPFFALSAMIDPFKIFAKRGLVELIEQLQDLKTALIRQVMINIAKSNEPQSILDPAKINVEDLIQGRQFIRAKGNMAGVKEAILPLPPQQLSQWTFQFLEFIEQERENRTGVTRYNMGVDGRNNLNDTATGITAIINQANQRIDLICRIVAETGMLDLYRFLVELNQNFVDEAMVIRLTNRQLTIRPDDLEGNYDLNVNAGVGMGTKEQNLRNFQLILGIFAQIQPVGITTAQNWYNLTAKIIEEMGYKNVEEFLTDPQTVRQMQLMQQKIAEQEQIIQQLGGGRFGQPGGIPGDALPANQAGQSVGTGERISGSVF